MPVVTPSIAMKSMLVVYLPLALTPLLSTLVRPIGSAALSRLPDYLGNHVLVSMTALVIPQLVMVIAPIALMIAAFAAAAVLAG